MQTLRSLVAFVAAARRNAGTLALMFTRFTSAPRSVQVMMIAAVLYALFPIDLIPDFVPAAGVLDDITVVALLFMLAWRRFTQHLQDSDFEEQQACDVQDDVNDAPLDATVRNSDGSETRTFVRRRPATSR